MRIGLKPSRRALSCALALVLLFSLAAPVLAADADVDIGDYSNVADDIAAAINEAHPSPSSGDTIEVTGTATVDDTVIIGDGDELEDVEVVWTANLYGSGNLGDDDLLEIDNIGNFTMAGGALVTDNGRALNARKSEVTITGGRIVSYDGDVAVGGFESVITMTGGVIASFGGAAVSQDGGDFYLEGGVVFGCGEIDEDGYCFGVTDLTDLTGNGIVIAWDKDNSPFTYTAGSSADLTCLPATAAVTWGTQAGKHGVLYSNGGNTGFLEVPGVTVTSAEPPPYIPPYTPPPSPEPEPEPTPPPTEQVWSFSVQDLDELWANAVDGVMVMVIPGDLLTLQIDVPLSWFMENLGATLLIYNEGLGLLAITSENMIELAALSYEGEGGVTMEVRGKELTFSPETVISYLLEKGSIKLSVSADGQPLDWYIYDSPVILGVPGDAGSGNDPDLWVVVEILPDGSEKVIPRSVIRGGLIYAMANSEGLFEVRYRDAGFDDVAGGWMETAVNFMAARGIVSGVGGNKFAPERQITRAEFITMLMKTMDYQMTDYDPAPFIDVNPEDWYYEHVCKAAALGITAGVGGGRFGPEMYITRQDMFTLTYNALVKFYLIMPCDDAGALTFADAPEIAEYALRAVTELFELGLVSGYNDNVNPAALSTRAEAAAFLANVIRHIVPDYGKLLAGL